MSIRRTLLILSCIALSSAPAVVSRAADAQQPGSPAYLQRDAENMLYATGRLEDEYANPAFGSTFWPETATQTFPANVELQASQPKGPILTLAQWIPGGTTADPYRTNWARGRVQAIDYPNRYGAHVTGHVWAPPATFVDPVTGLPNAGPYPAIVITTGSIQGYEELYWWAAQGLAEAGYVVMTYDVQGQGQTETFGHHPDGSLWCDSSCPGVPFQQEANFTEGTLDAIAWFKGSANPFGTLVDFTRLGLAGHSLGATAVTKLGNTPSVAAANNIKAVVAWDGAALAANQAPLVPTMAQNAEYFFNPQPYFMNAGPSGASVPDPGAAPNPDAKNGVFRAFRLVGVDSMQVALRGSTHLEWTYVPYILPASKDGERVAMHYTLAWFDRYLYPARLADATTRLEACTFDDSADASAIGAGDWDAATNSNKPHVLAGIPVPDKLSFYYASSYAIGSDRVDDLRTACS